MLRRLIKPHLFAVGALVLISAILFITNYSPGTFLLGWDNVVPEFNFPANLMRSIFGVWQQNRGLGLYDGMSHVANLTHTLLLWGLSAVVPISMLRYLFTFLMHLAGGVGIYFLIFWLLNKKFSEQNLLVSLISGLGGLFYLINPATIQMFYTPLESYSIHFASLPWLALGLLKYLDSGSKKSFLGFCLVMFLTSAQYFVATLLIPVFILLSFLSAAAIFASRNKIVVKRVIIAALTFFCLNAFWLLPYLWGIRQNAPVIANAKINQMSSGEVFARNQAFGDVKNVLLLRGFSLDYEDFLSSGTFGYLMAPWRTHLLSPVSSAVSIIFIILTILGIGATLLNKRRNNEYLGFILIFAVGLIALGNDIPGIKEATEALRSNLPFIAEALRFPFTKFSLLFALSYTILLSIGINALILRAKRYRFLLLSGFLLVIVYLGYPAFQGNFIYQNLKINLPDEYLSLFNYFQHQNDDKRIMLLPQQYFWSWKYYHFGYRGSGFLWYGLAQPLMDRAFDPWSAQNENYYWELSRALYAKDISSLSLVIKKYQIGHFILDENTMSTDDDRSLFIPDSLEMLGKMPNVREEIKFGKIHVYQITDGQKMVSLASLPTVSPTYRWTDNDQAYKDLGDYISNLPSNEQPITNNYSYPFRSLFTKRAIDEREFRIVDAGQSFNIVSSNSSTSSAIQKDLVFDSSVSKTFKEGNFTKCGLVRSGSASKNLLNENFTFLRLESSNQRGCVNFDIPNLPHKEGYLVAVNSRHISGRSVNFALINDTAKHTELETTLSIASDWQTQYFILPPLASDGLGYAVYIANDAIGKYKSVNDIADIKIYKFPYDQLTHMRFSSSSQRFTINDLRLTASSVSHPNPAFYKVAFPSNQVTNNPASPAGRQGTLILSQSYDPGWIAWDGKRFLPHVLVNNWENGWLLKKLTVNGSPSTVYLFFWPQLLEFAGFALLPIPLLIVLVFARQDPRRN